MGGASTMGESMAEPRRVGAGERLMRVETQMEHVEAALNKGSASFEKLREATDRLAQLVTETHAACVKPADLALRDDRITKLEAFRARVKRFGWLASILASGAIGAIALFGPDKIAAAFEQLWT